MHLVGGPFLVFAARFILAFLAAGFKTNSWSTRREAEADEAAELAEEPPSMLKLGVFVGKSTLCVAFL